MSKIGSYALEVMDDETNTRYRDNMEAGSYLVLWNPTRGRVKAEVTSELDATRTSYTEYELHNRTQHHRV